MTRKTIITLALQQSLPLIGRPADQEESRTTYNALLEVHHELILLID